MNNGKQIQLFLLPFAGGSSESFNNLINYLDDRIETITIEYAGRGTRAKEPLATSFEELLEDAIDFTVNHRNNTIPYSVLGYSMGSIFAYELLRRNVLYDKPVHTFLCAELSPKDRATDFSLVDNPDDVYVLNRARKLGGLNETLLNNNRFYDIYVRPMLSDYKLLYSYRFNNNYSIISTDVTFFYSEKDTPYNKLLGWRELIDGKFDYYEYGDNHFFINKYYQEMADIINAHLDFFLK